MKTTWNERNILIIGAARQGLALSRYLASQGALVTLTDSRDEEQLIKERQSLAGYQIKWHFGGHPTSLLEGKDLVCVSGGVPLTIPLIVEARKQSIPLSNDSQIFFEQVTCSVVGITGSAGKTTTTTLIGAMAKKSAAHPEKVWIGGNIGTPLIEQVEQIKDDHIVFLELSSFQLELMTISPHIALVTNITPNHLDRHASLEEYTKAKAHILDYQKAEDVAILNHDDIGAWKLRDSVRGKLFSFGLEPRRDDQNCVFIQGNEIFSQRDGQRKKLASIEKIFLRGKHNLYNILAACAIADFIRLSTNAVQDTIINFKGVPHRLEFVSEKHGIRWYNDSIATAPERTMAAIQSFDEPLVLLLGGKDKKLPWDKLVTLIQQKVDHVILFGADAHVIENAIGNLIPGQRPYSLQRFDSLEEAVLAASQIAKSGDIVLLSPGATSYDEFKDFEERGEKYRLWVHQLP